MGNLKIRRQKERVRAPVVRPFSGLLKNALSISGRSNKGQLALYHRGGRSARRYRFIDFRRGLWNFPSVVLYNEYDPNRTSLITLICFYNGIVSYILNTESVGPGDVLFAGAKYSFLNYGNYLPIRLIPEGSMIHSLELRPLLGSTVVRSAGSFAILVKKFFDIKKILLRLPSKEEVLVDLYLMATMGQVSRIHHKVESIYKAGIQRIRGFRPVVRGVAKNPIDHPHGGGGGKCQETPWSKPAKMVPTRRKGSFFVILKSRVLRKFK